MNVILNVEFYYVEGIENLADISIRGKSFKELRECEL